jgi:hypothetical protein
MRSTALLHLWKMWRYGFLSPLKVHRSRPVLNPQTLGQMASTLVITQPWTSVPRSALLLHILEPHDCFWVLTSNILKFQGHLQRILVNVRIKPQNIWLLISTASHVHRLNHPPIQGYVSFHLTESWYMKEQICLHTSLPIYTVNMAPWRSRRTHDDDLTWPLLNFNCSINLPLNTIHNFIFLSIPWRAIHSGNKVY